MTVKILFFKMKVLNLETFAFEDIEMTPVHFARSLGIPSRTLRRNSAWRKFHAAYFLPGKFSALLSYRRQEFL